MFSHGRTLPLAPCPRYQQPLRGLRWSSSKCRGKKKKEAFSLFLNCITCGWSTFPPPTSQNRQARFSVQGVRWKTNRQRQTSASPPGFSSQGGVWTGSFLHECMETKEDETLSKRTSSLHVLGDGKGFDGVILLIKVLYNLWRFYKLAKNVHKTWSKDKCFRNNYMILLTFQMCKLLSLSFKF